MIIDTLNQKIGEAMKAHDDVRVSTFKLLFAEIHNFQIDHKDMTEEEELAVVKKEAKRRRDSIESFEKFQNSKNPKLKATLKFKIQSEKAELKILQEFLPEEITDAELSKFVDEAINETGAKEIKEIGKVIGVVMKKAQGNADGGKIAQMVKSKLSS